MCIFEYDEEAHMKCIRQEGFEKGEEMKVITQVCRKLQKQKSPVQIAEELEEAPELIARICEAAEKCAPDYNCEEIYRIMKDLEY